MHRERIARRIAAHESKFEEIGRRFAAAKKLLRIHHRNDHTECNSKKIILHAEPRISYTAQP